LLLYNLIQRSFINNIGILLNYNISDNIICSGVHVQCFLR